MHTPSFQIPLKKALQSLQASNQEFIELFSHGSLVVEIYQPHLVDRQTPHNRDEIYVIISGYGEFVLEGERTTFSPGDVLFVPAKKEHRFERFTNNFSTWVFFFGAEK